MKLFFNSRLYYVLGTSSKLFNELRWKNSEDHDFVFYSNNQLLTAFTTAYLFLYVYGNMYLFKKQTFRVSQK